MSTTEESLEDEDPSVVGISHNLRICSLEKNGNVFENICNTASKVESKNQNVFCYTTNNSFEFALDFNRNLPLEDSDPFLKKLKVALKRFPSINSESSQKKKIANKGKKQIPIPSTNQISRNEENTLQEQMTIKSFKRKYHTSVAGSVSSETHQIPFKNDLEKDICERYNKVSESTYLFEPSIEINYQNKFKNLVGNLCKTEDSSFSEVFLNHKQEFLELLPQIDVIPDVVPQVIEVMLKIFNLEHPSRDNILVSFLHEEFIGKIISYITLLPTECDENLPDNEIENLFHNILALCEKINNTMYTKSAEVLDKILRALQYGIKGFNETQNLNLDEKILEKIGKLKEEMKSQMQKEPRKRKKELENTEDPPDSIKDIDIYPSQKDLFEPATFLRKNIVNGSYRNINHYIDVHFRLLREDFIAPLRKGIQLYCESVSKGHQDQNQRYDDISIHEGVRILHGTITNGRFGHLVQLTSNIGFQNDSKRFMFGSLVLFTADNFESFFCGTVIDHAGENLLTVELLNDDLHLDEIYNNYYTMIESEIYFEPYYHVLTALQEINCTTFPMKEYIVDVKSNTKTCNETVVHGKCPSTLNESQIKAFKSAMVNEFVVIQGPPGTGKTFLAEAIVKKLLVDKGSYIIVITNHRRPLFDMSDEDDVQRFEEFKLASRERKKDREWRSVCLYNLSESKRPVFHKFFCEEEIEDKPILVICYTNHALDQFLERLASFTKKLIRVGGQSKNRTVQHFNLKVIRKCWIKEQSFNCRRCNCYYKCNVQVRKLDEYFQHLNYIQDYTFRYLVNLKILETIISDGVLKVNNLVHWMSPKLRGILLRQRQFEAWLMEGAYVLQIEDKDLNDNVKPELTFHTQQLLSEFHESRSYWDDEDMFDFRSVESRSSAEADNKFLVKRSKVKRQSETIQGRLRKCRQKGRNENIINMYENQIEDLEKQRRYIAYMLARKTPVDLKKIRELNKSSNIWAIDFEDRWMLYNYWVQQYQNKIKNDMLRVEMSLKAEEQRYNMRRDKLDLELLKSANVIGMTTTSAARLRNMLVEVGPEIVLVEEAAEVLESHIVAALNPSVKKVILIGDHKQLRPSPAVYELAQRYQLDVSLFERMINNGVACQVLDTQQRMRPEIASLIAPAIYPDLKNGERVLDRPDILGVAANVFFVTHNKFEDESFGENKSHRNSHEVHFLMSFCQYLLQQGYDASEITILATYLGQLTALEYERRRRNLPGGLRIATVDNYQGEENDIILLSLVRSNAEARIGFLSKENRVCVALSRAKNGLYMIGNMDNLTQNSSIWRQVKAQLQSMNAIGPALPLGCRNHQNDKSMVSCSNDFKEVPRSGCKLKCGAELECGHVCTEFCHSLDIEHTEEFACQLPCERIMPCGEHRCTKNCGAECGSCTVPVERQLECGHLAQMACSADPARKLCRVRSTFTSDTCGHVVTKLCHEKEATCNEPCTGFMDCGHPCVRLCHHSTRDRDHWQKFCPVETEKTLPCGHTFTVVCKYLYSKSSCQEPCPKTLPCGHPCAKLCGERCTDACDTLVEKTLSPCGHPLLLPCSSPTDSSQCRQPCQLTLPCGHPCPGSCSADCSRFTCQESVLCTIEPACNHGLIRVPCYVNVTELRANSDQLLQHCKAPCRADLPCGHLCLGRCGDCLQGRLHVPCSYPCARVLKCGHRCERECCNECPLICDQPCKYRCPHQACPLLCGDPCTPCQKQCGRRCRHQRCSRVCGEACDCPPCEEPCPLTLPCGHPCPSFCGEPCTQHCRVCDPEIFTIPGYKNNPCERFVSLEDCGHPVSENLLRKLLEGDEVLSGIKKCPICEEPIRFVLRYKDGIQQLYSHLANAKEKQNLQVTVFESKMKDEKKNLKYYSDNLLETYGDHAFFIFEHLKKAPPVYKTSMHVFTFFKHLTKTDRHSEREDKSWDLVIERRRLLLGALALRLKSMSSTDYTEFLTEIFRLDLAMKNWPTGCDLLLSLRKYSLDELKALE